VLHKASHCYTELEQILSDRKVELADMHTVTHFVEDLRNILNHSSVTEKKSFIKSFIREAEVAGKEVTIRYSLPVECRLITERAIAVPPIVHYGGAHYFCNKHEAWDNIIF
jgi:hypothetical protein